MLANDVIDFLMDELDKPATCPRKVRQTIKQLATIHSGLSQGRRMLTEQLIDILFELYTRGQTDTVELGSALKTKLNRYIHSRFVPVRLEGLVLPLRRVRKPILPTKLKELHT
jgi:hypothetical protein